MLQQFFGNNDEVLKVIEDCQSNEISDHQQVIWVDLKINMTDQNKLY